MYCLELCPDQCTVEVEVISELFKCLLYDLFKKFWLYYHTMKGRGIKVFVHLVKEISWPLLVPTVQCCGVSQTRPHSGCSVWRILVLAPQPWLSSTHLSPHYFVILSHHNSIINNTQKMAQENDYGDLGWPGTQGHTSFPVTWIMKNPFVSFVENWKGARWWSVVVNIYIN